MPSEGALEKVQDNNSYFRATVSYSTFVGRRFDKTDFRRLEGRLTSFEGCHFVDCDFSNANLTYSRFINCILEFTDDFEISDASFSGAYFEKTDFSTKGRLRFKHCSLRDVHFAKCKFGTLDFTSNGLEDSFFDSCSFDELDIRSVAATALMFSSSRFGLVRVSVENFTLIIGASALLLAADNFELSHLASSSQSNSGSTLNQAVQILTEYLDETDVGAFQAMSTHISLCALRGVEPNISILDQIVCQLGSDTPLFFFDQVANIIKLINHQFLFEQINLEPLRVAFRRNQEHLTKLPHSLAMRVKAAEGYLFDSKETEFEFSFVFQAADANNPLDRVACYEFLHSVMSLAHLASSDGGSIAEGSFKLSEVVRLSKLSRWLVAVVVLANSIEVQVNFDVNKLAEDIIGAAARLQASITNSELAELQRKSQELDLMIEIQRKQHELNRLLGPEDLTLELQEAARLYGDHQTLPSETVNTAI